MNIGIIVHSQTGNTHSVAVKLQEKLSAAGHAVTLERLQVAGAIKPGTRDIPFETLPDTGRYDMLVFGAPVNAFSLSPVMKSYLNQVTAVRGKGVSLLVTQQFPYAWMGGHRAINQMRAACEAKGAVVLERGIVNWSRKERDQQIREVVDRLCKAMSTLEE